MKFTNKFFKVALLAVFALPLASQAAVTSVADLWASISFADVTSAIFGIGALVIGVDLAQLGYFKVRRLVKGAH
ncbi:hypothetical protein NX784_10610 [Massilia pinisoli]|uniref:Phage coat protein n=1 Tax=Massilia pinisoli TaxID=1772194 RepID=A0ABT1ZQ45_9BURK|nr:hypothetical protein [Massilia pinisoli]MCS0582042.1 hypothetical protein [Massilia pinisoli]